MFLAVFLTSLTAHSAQAAASQKPERLFGHPTGWSNVETEVRVYTAAGEPVETEGPPEGRPLRAIPWGAPAWAPGRYAVAWSGRNQAGEPLASGVYLIQLKVRNPDTGEVVPVLKKVLVIR